MSTQNIDDRKLSLDQEGETPQKLTYRSPKIHHFGSLERLEAAPRGDYYDGPNQRYFLPRQ
jgi:hypothetical protein